jgi:hypothetical protein
MAARFDQLVSDAGVGLAKRVSRRSLLGRVGAGAAAVGGIQLFGIARTSKAALVGAPCMNGAPRCGRDGCWDSNSIDVCYAPWRAVRDSWLRVGPSSSAPTVKANGVAVQLKAGNPFGRQSTRNPGCDPSPPLRGAAGSPPYVWGYIVQPPGTSVFGNGKMGWINLADIVDYSSYPHLTCATADFDCRTSVNTCRRCDCAENPGSASSVSGRADVDADDLYLRYGPGSTAYRYLVRNDVVDMLCRVGDYTCVSVVSADWAPTGGRGWVETAWL